VTSRFATSLRLLSYMGIAFACLIISFAVGQGHAVAGSPDVIDLTITTIGASEQIQLPLGTGNSFSNVPIVWGDGTTTIVTSAADTTDMAHTYTSAGTYLLKVQQQSGGNVGHFGNGAAPWTAGAAYVSAVTYFSPSLTSLSGAFYGATNLIGTTPTLPTSVTDLSYMFYNASSINDPNISSYITTNVTNMSYMFYQATSFNKNLNGWNTANVTNMDHVFYGAVAYANAGGVLTGWNTAKVTNMSWMFAGAILFNANISTWNTAAVTNMSYMFYGGTAGPINTTATIFNDGGVALTTVGNSWNVGAVTVFDYMFANDTGINVAMSNWNAGSVASASMLDMFAGAGAFNQNISTWNVSKVIDMSYMFYQASAFNNGSSSGTANALAWNTASVINMSFMFYQDTALNVNISTWTTNTVTNMADMFYQATSFNDGGVAMATSTNVWNVSAVTNMTSMFEGDTTFADGTGTGLSTWTTSALQQMPRIFFGTLVNETLTKWKTNVITPNGMTNWENGSFNVVNYSATLAAFVANGLSAANVSTLPTVSNSFYNQVGVNARTTLTSKGWVFSGDTFYGITTSTTNNGASGPKAVGDTIIFTAIVTGSSPPGAPSIATEPNTAGLWTLTQNGVTKFCTTTPTATVAGLVTTYTCTFLITSGNETLSSTFTYNNDALDSNYTKVVAAASTYLPAKGTLTQTLVANTLTAALGSTITFTETLTAVVNGVKPTGSLNYWTVSGPGGINSCVTTSGPAGSLNVVTYQCTITATSAGTYAATFTYPGDIHYLAPGAISASPSTSVAQATPLVVVTILPVTVLLSPSSNSNPAVFTATVTGPVGGATPTGSGTWNITGVATPACTVNTGPISASNIATYTCTLQTAVAGTYVAHFIYPGDINYLNVGTTASGTLTVTLNTPVVTFVASNATTANIGNSFTFTAVMTPTNPQSPFPLVTGTGTWSYKVNGGGSNSCSSTTSVVGAATSSNATAAETFTCTVTNASASGTYIASFLYPGDSNYLAIAFTADANQTIVGKATPTVAVSGNNGVTLGGNVIFTATVTGPSGGVTPTGVPTWTIGGVTGITSCTSTTLPTGGSNIATYTCTVIASKAGTYSATFTYPSDTNYNSVAPTSSSPNVTVATFTPTVVVTANAASATLGTSLIFTAIVTGPANATSPNAISSLSITGVSGTTVCAQAAAKPGVPSANATTYSCSVTATVVGSYGATFTYPGDLNYNAVAATASLSNTTVGLGSPTITLTPSATSASLGSTFVFTATVAPQTNAAMPTGAASWAITGVTGVSVCTSTSGPITTSYVTYTCTVTASKSGTYGATFTYIGDTNYSQTILSASQTVSVAKITPTVAVTANAATANLADLITFTAVVTGTTNAVNPSGNGTWLITGVSGITACQSITGPSGGVNSSVYTCSLLALKAGTYGATFSVAQDTSYNAVANAVSSTQTGVSLYTPTVQVTASTPTANLGSSFSFTATVQGPSSGPPPTGSGSWNITGVTGVFCSSQTGPTGASNVVTYTCTVTATSAGIYVPLFTFNGDSNYAATSPTSGYTTSVAKATPTLAASANSTTGALGTLIGFTATVAGPTGAVAPSGAGIWTITGVSGISACTTTTGPVPASNVSTYTCSVNASISGTYQATFGFAGDGAYYSVAAISTTNSTLVAIATPTISLAETGSTTLGGSILFTANVTGSSNASAPVGTVNWAVSGSASVTTCSSTTGPVTNGIIATYTCTVQTPYAGGYSVQANFVGGQSYASISSSTLNFTITKQIPTITLTASSNPVLDGTTTLTTSVSGITNAILPSGAVTWTLTNPTGGSITCNNPTGPTTQSGVETYTCNFITSATGTYHATTTIATDGNYSAATSSIVSVNILTATPTIFANYSPSNPTVGQVLTITALVTGKSGSGAPTGTLTWNISGQAVLCTSNPATVTGTLTELFTCTVATPTAGTYTFTATTTAMLHTPRYLLQLPKISLYPRGLRR
jgi:surface protein